MKTKIFFKSDCKYVLQSRKAGAQNILDFKEVGSRVLGSLSLDRLG